MYIVGKRWCIVHGLRESCYLLRIATGRASDLLSFIGRPSRSLLPNFHVKRFFGGNSFSFLRWHETDQAVAFENEVNGMQTGIGDQLAKCNQLSISYFINLKKWIQNFFSTKYTEYRSRKHAKNKRDNSQMQNVITTLSNHHHKKTSLLQRKKQHRNFSDGN